MGKREWGGLRWTAATMAIAALAIGMGLVLKKHGLGIAAEVATLVSLVPMAPGLVGWAQARHDNDHIADDADNLRQVASMGLVASRIQRSVARHEVLIAALVEMLDRLSAAKDSLTTERDWLTEVIETRQRTSPAAELRIELQELRKQLSSTQQRLAAAERLQVATRLRLEDSERQRKIAERLRDRALTEAEVARGRLAAVEYVPPAPADEDQHRGAVADLMGETDQQTGEEVLCRIDRILSDESIALSRLNASFPAPPGVESSSRGAWRPTSRIALIIGLAGTVVIGGAVVIKRHSSAPRALVWMFQTDGRVQSSPALSGGVVYIGSDDHSVYALDSVTGKLRWRYATGGGVRSSPMVTRGTVYVGSNDHKVYALSAANGVPRWVFKTGGIAQSVPALAPGMVYIGSNDDDLYALDSVTGKLRWRYATGGGVLSSPAVANRTVYVGSGDGNVYALNAATGRLRWKYATRDPVYAKAAVVRGVVYIGGINGNMYALDAVTGKPLWVYRIGDPIYSRPAVAGRDIYIGGGGSNAGPLSDGHGYIYALDAETGRFRWRYRTAAPVNCSPAVVSGVVYVGGDNGNVYALDAGSGQVLWIYPTGGDAYSSPVVANGVVYIGSDDDRVYALSSAHAL